MREDASKGRGNRPVLEWAVMAAMVVAVSAPPAGAQDWQQRLVELEQGAPLLASLEVADLAQAPETFGVDIPSQPLPQAIASLSAVTGLQVLYTEDQAFGRTAPAVVGSYTAEQALDLLLQGSGLTYRFVGSDAVTLEAIPAVDESGVVTLPAVTVTGERVERSIMDTATSVAVFGEEDFERRPALETTNDVLERVPNVTPSETSNLVPAVRGVDGTGPAQGADAFFAGTRPRLNVQVDGRPASYNEVVFGDFSLWDVQQVEVLRGPQSTLQGRNAIAGTVVVKSKDPSFDYEAAGRVIGGNQEYRQLSAMVSGPIVDDQLAFRLAADKGLRDSYTHMTAYSNADDPENFDFLTLRGKLLLEPKTWQEFSALLTISHVDYSAPQVESVAVPFDEHVSSYPNMPVFNPSSTSATVETTLDLGDGMAFETTLSAASLNVKRLAVEGDGNAVINSKELMGEPRLRFSAFDDRLDGLAGVYVFRSSQDEYIDLFGGGIFDDSTETEAVFAEGTYALLDDLDLTAGARLEQERRRREGADGPFAIDLDETYKAFLPKLGLAWHATDGLTLGAVVSRGYNGGGAGFTYDPPFQSYVFETEYVWTYEAYARADLDDGRLSLTGNVFYSDYSNMQLPFDLNPDPTIWSVVIRNADEAVTYGAELGVRWLALPGLELFGDVGLLHTEITSYPNSGVEGNELPRAPAFSVDVGASYEDPSGFDLAADLRFSDKYYSSVTNELRGEVDPFVVVNAQAGYSIHENARIFAFVANLFDSDNAVLIEPGAATADDVGYLLRPRTFGIGLEVTF